MPTASRMTIVTHGDEATIEQIIKQLNKLPDVLKVQDFHKGEYIGPRTGAGKVAVDSKSRAEVMQITDIFRAKIVDVQPQNVTIEITGDESKVDKFLELMKTFGVQELDPHGQSGPAPEIAPIRRSQRKSSNPNRINYLCRKSLYRQRRRSRRVEK